MKAIVRCKNKFLQFKYKCKKTIKIANKTPISRNKRHASNEIK